MEKDALIIKSASGATLGTLALGVRLILGALAHLLIARMLFPNELGDYALALAICGFLSALVSLNVNTYLVQVRTDYAKAFSTAIVTQTLASILGILVTIFGAHRISLLAGSSTAVPFLLYLSPMIFLGPLVAALRANLERDLRFGATSRATIWGAVIHILSLGVMLWAGYRGMALVGAILIQHLAESALLFIRGRNTISFTFSIDREARHSLFRYGIPALISGALLYLAWNIDQAMVSRYLDQTQLGYYYFALRFPYYLQLLSNVAISVSLPLFTKLDGDKETLTRALGLLTRYTAYVMGWLTVLVITLGHDLILYIFGERWLPALLPFQVFMVVVSLRNIFTYWVPLHQSHSTTKYQLILTPIHLTLVIVLGYIFVHRSGIDGMSFAILAATLASSVLCIPRIVRIFLPQFSYLRSLAYPALISLVVAAVPALFMRNAGPLANLAKGLLVTALFGGLVYLLDRGFKQEFNYLVRLIRKESGS